MNTSPVPGASDEANDGHSTDLYERLLLADYQASRFTFERIDATGLSLITLALTVSTLLLARVIPSCDLATLSCHSSRWAPAYSLLPALPLAFLLLYADNANSRIVRSYYVRSLESRLRHLTSEPNGCRHAIADSRLPLATYGDLHAALFGQRRGSQRYRLAVGFVYVCVALPLIALVLVSIRSTRPIDLQVVAAAVYFPFLVLLARLLWLGSVGARQLWDDAQEAYAEALMPEAHVRRSVESRLRLRYLLVPRPLELLARSPIVLSAYLITSLLEKGGDSGSFPRAVLIAVTFEVLVYQAGYMVNDLRGLGADANFSPYKAAHRMPLPPTKGNLVACIVVCFFRLALASWISLRYLNTSTTWLLLAMFGLHIALYEAVRTLGVRRATKACFTRLRATYVVLFALAGGGYMLRGAIGMAAASPGFILGADGWLTTTAGLITWWLMGVTAVTAAWAYTVSDQLLVGSRANLPAYRVRSALLTSPHLGPLAFQARLLGRSVSFASVRYGVGSDLSLRRSRVLLYLSGPTTWNVAFWCLSGSVLVWVGSYHLDNSRIAVYGGLGLSAGVWLSQRFGRTDDGGKWLTGSAFAGAACSIGIVALGGLLLGVPAGPLTICTVAWSCFAILYCGFRGATLEGLQRGPAAVVRRAPGVLTAISRVTIRTLFGSEVEQRLWPPV